MNEVNLSLLADYLESEVKDEQFSMESFRAEKGVQDVTYWAKHECGSIGCALGWGPFVKGLEVKDEDFDDDGSLSFWNYSERVFGLASQDPEWEFMFDSRWKDHDDTRKGAIDRIRIVAHHKDINLSVPWET